jgi:hypothetical protein
LVESEPGDVGELIVTDGRGPSMIAASYTAVT